MTYTVSSGTLNLTQLQLCYTAEEPRDALRQLKYYGRFLTELLTRSSANAEEPCEHSQLKSCKMLHKCSTDCT